MKANAIRTHSPPNDSLQRSPRTARPAKKRGTGGAGGWYHIAKLAFFVALGFVRFVGEVRGGAAAGTPANSAGNVRGPLGRQRTNNSRKERYDDGLGRAIGNSSLST
jgi:hypothetical protein